jgi:hypothetical protein
VKSFHSESRNHLLCAIAYPCASLCLFRFLVHVVPTKCRGCHECPFTQSSAVISWPIRPPHPRSISYTEDQNLVPVQKPSISQTVPPTCPMKLRSFASRSNLIDHCDRCKSQAFEYLAHKVVYSPERLDCGCCPQLTFFRGRNHLFREMNHI